MSQAWYLLNSSNDMVSGYENELIDDYSIDGFLEALNTRMADDIEIYNYNLSQCNRTRAIVQNRVQDTKLKTLSRHIFVPIGTCQAGMYVKYKGRYWIITGLVDDNGVYEKAVLSICNYLLTWFNDDGEIIQRWANVQSASQYNNGQENQRNFVLRSDQLMLLIPDDDESTLLSIGKRFIIDKRCKVYQNSFDQTVLSDTSKPLTTYVLSRPDTVIFDYQISGTNQLLVSEDEKQKNDGYYVVDGNGYWLCGIPEQDVTNNNRCEITYNSLILFNGIGASVYTAHFFDNLGEEVENEPEWNIISEFTSDLDISYDGNSILIGVDDGSLNNKSFTLSLSGEGYDATTITIRIKAFI